MSVLRLGPIISAWLVTIGIDFLVFGGLATSAFERSDPSLLDSDALFARIPAAYVAFALLVWLVAWIIEGRSAFDPRAGTSIGALVGVAIGTAMGLAIWSFATVPVGILVIWAVVVCFQLGAAGAILVWVARGGRKAAVGSVAIFASLIVAGVVAQNVL